MNTATRNALNAYVKTGIETAIPEANPHQLVMMLFEGALAAIADARLNMIRGQIAARGKSISKAMAIVDQGLKCSLDKERGGELAERLDALYEYIGAKLLEANAQSRSEPLDEAERLLNEIYGAWTEIGKAPATLKVAQAGRA
jgi:flagellar protein FliS